MVLINSKTKVLLAIIFGRIVFPPTSLTKQLLNRLLFVAARPWGGVASQTIRRQSYVYVLLTRCERVEVTDSTTT